MRNKFFLTIVVICIALRSMEVYCGTKSSGTAAGVYLEFPVPLTIADFDDGKPWNLVGGSYGTYSSNPAASCYYVFVSTISSTAGNFLEINYDFTSAPSGEHCGFLMNLSPLGWDKKSGLDLSNYKSMEFKVRGSGNQGDQIFKIELSTCDYTPTRVTASLYIGDYLDGGVSPVNISTITIPLSAFVNISTSNRNNIYGLNLIFEKDTLVLHGKPLSGKVYIDDIIFKETSPSHLRVDFFGDLIGKNALGGNIGCWEQNNPPHYRNVFVSTEVFSTGYALEHHYYTDNGNDNYGGWSLKIGGGSSGDENIPISFEEIIYLNFKFYVKAKSDSENPKKCKVEFKYKNNVEDYYYFDISTTWNQISITLLKRIFDEIVFVFEDWKINDAGGARNGVVYFDNLQFSWQ